MKCWCYLVILCFFSCHGQPVMEQPPVEKQIDKKPNLRDNTNYNLCTKTIHVFVALCDNENQGIVPVSKTLGNGQNPNTNLYWGSAYGMKTYFKKSRQWKFISAKPLNDTVLERLIFKHKNTKTFLVVDAYDGKYIKQTTIDFLHASSGQEKDTLQLSGSKPIGINGNAMLLAYIGHDGLMDFILNEKFENTDHRMRDVIILACYSKHYFSQHLQQANVNPLIWSSGLMAPEAYTIHDALSAYLNKEDNKSIQTKAAAAYNKYQKCGLNAAKRLLVTGW